MGLGEAVWEVEGDEPCDGDDVGEAVAESDCVADSEGVWV